MRHPVPNVGSLGLNQRSNNATFINAWLNHLFEWILGFPSSSLSCANNILNCVVPGGAAGGDGGQRGDAQRGDAQLPGPVGEGE